MALILKDILHLAPEEYNASAFNILIRKLQQILGINVATQADMDEIEAIRYFERD